MNSQYYYLYQFFHRKNMVLNPKNGFLDSQVNQLELRMTMGELEEKLDKDTFCRVHKGYLVNFGHVIRIDKDVISMSNGDNVYISRQKIKDVRSKYLTYVRIKGGLVF